MFLHEVCYICLLQSCLIFMELHSQEPDCSFFFLILCCSVVVPCILHAVPATPRYHVCALYDMVDGTLQIIESTWNEVVCCICINLCFFSVILFYYFGVWIKHYNQPMAFQMYMSSLLLFTMFYLRVDGGQILMSTSLSLLLLHV